MLRTKRTDWQTKEVTENTEFVGRSLFVRWQTVQVMSDIWEQHLVLHSVDDEGRIVERSVAGWYGENADSRPVYEVDATDEAYELVRKREASWRFDKMLAEAQARAEDPCVKGRVVKVVSGRRAKGTIGKVVVIMERPYGMGYRSVMMNKLGIATSPRKVKVERNGRTFENYADMEWVWAKNCEAEKPETVDEATIRAEAEAQAARFVENLRKQAAEYAAKAAA